MRGAPLRLVLVLLVVAATACQVDVSVDVTMHEDGSGVVEVVVALDPEAAARIPDLADQLRVDDLETAGWTVAGPEVDAAGRTVVRASKPFGTPVEGEAVLREVGGGVIFQGQELSRHRSFARTAFRFAATVDLTAGAETFADAEVTALLGGDSFGGNREEIEEATGKTLEEQVSFTVTAELPGGSRTWDLLIGAEDVDELELASTEWRPVTLGLIPLSAVLLLAGLSVLARGASRRGRDGVAEDEASDPGPVVDDLGEEAASRGLALVVLDAMSVVVATGADTADLLVEFVRAKGSDADEAAVRDAYSSACAGRLSVGELWVAAGLSGDAGNLTDEFLAHHRVNPDIHDFLERMRERGLKVAVVANDVAEWSRRLRSTHRLDPFTAAWVVSGDLGELMPGGSVFGRVIQVTGIEAKSSLFLSRTPEFLAAARSFGFAPALFAPDGAPGGSGYPVVTSLGDLVG